MDRRPQLVSAGACVGAARLRWHRTKDADAPSAACLYYHLPQANGDLNPELYEPKASGAPGAASRLSRDARQQYEGQSRTCPSVIRQLYYASSTLLRLPCLVLQWMTPWPLHVLA
jgi:hypothetical protein